MAAYRDSRREEPRNLNDSPPNSRVFVLAGRGTKEEDYRECFGKFGTIEDVWIVKDRRTNEDKGITYIKFARASEAALAMEEMNGRPLPNHPKPIKVIIASNRKEGNVRDPREEEKLVRLFVLVPKKFTEDDLQQEFKKYGDIEYTQIVRDRSTGDNKGFGYVKFHRAYHAALALEGCDPVFKPKFADPKSRKGERDREERENMREEFDYRYDRGTKRMFSDQPMYDDYLVMDDRRGHGGHAGHAGHSGHGGHGGHGGHDRNSGGFGMGLIAPLIHSPVAAMGGPGPAEMLQTYPNTGCQRLHITAPLGMTESYLSRLFNLIPGLEYCDLNEQTGLAYARYQSPACAAYAHDKLDGFEYPIGSRLIVRYADSQPPADLASTAMKGYGGSGGHGGGRDHSPVAGNSNTFERAASLLERAGIDPVEVLAVGMERVRYCNILLPMPQPLKPEGTECRERLFIVCQPLSIPEKILRDAFCRFGNLIDVFLLSGRNYGYAKYSDTQSAQKAITTLHGQTLAGNRLKVIEAEPPKDERHHDRGHDRRDELSPNKKQRT